MANEQRPQAAGIDKGKDAAAAKQKELTEMNKRKAEEKKKSNEEKLRREQYLRRLEQRRTTRDLKRAR